MRVHCSATTTFNIRNRKTDEEIASLYRFDLHASTIMLFIRTTYTRENNHNEKQNNRINTHAIDEVFIIDI